MINNLIKTFTSLPGIGNKSATRFAYYILEHHKEKGLELAKSLELAIKNIKNCRNCRTLTENEFCKICINPKRNSAQLCVVENPSSINSIENSGAYSGKYFVLGGYLSPIDGIGVEELGFDKLQIIIENNNIEEIILATNSSIEGEVTNGYIENLFKNKNIKISKLARGIPLGGELEYTDINTIAKALTDRF